MEEFIASVYTILTMLSLVVLIVIPMLYYAISFIFRKRKLNVRRKSWEHLCQSSKTALQFTEPGDSSLQLETLYLHPNPFGFYSSTDQPYTSNITLVYNTLGAVIEIHTTYSTPPKHHPITHTERTQPSDPANSENTPAPTGDSNFDDTFTTLASPDSPPLPLTTRNALLACTQHETHIATLFDKNGAVSSFTPSVHIPLDDIIQHHNTILKHTEYDTAQTIQPQHTPAFQTALN